VGGGNRGGCTQEFSSRHFRRPGIFQEFCGERMRAGSDVYVGGSICEIQVRERERADFDL